MKDLWAGIPPRGDTRRTLAGGRSARRRAGHTVLVVHDSSPHTVSAIRSGEVDGSATPWSDGSGRHGKTEHCPLDIHAAHVLLGRRSPNSVSVMDGRAS